MLRCFAWVSETAIATFPTAPLPPPQPGAPAALYVSPADVSGSAFSRAAASSISLGVVTVYTTDVAGNIIGKLKRFAELISTDWPILNPGLK